MNETTPEEQIKLPKNKRNVKKIVLWTVLAVLVLFCLVSLIADKYILNDMFSRAERSDYTVSLLYSDVQDSYSREPIEFYSGETKLRGYVYGAENDKGLIVISHGMGGGHEDYMADICWFVDRGWRVLGFDNTGCCESEGDSMVGMVQSALDLDAALDCVESDPELSVLPACLYGHSWGGYAVTAVLNFDHDIAASASMAGYDDPVDVEIEWGKGMMGGLIYTQYPFLWLYNKLAFGEYAGLSAVDGINRTDTPVLIVHGDGDTVVGYNGSGIIAKRDRITNPNARFLTLSDEGSNGHSSIFQSRETAKYMSQLLDEYNALEEAAGGELSEEAEAKFYGKVDKEKANELNPELMNAVEEFFQEALEERAAA